jgi:hypothetical protein
MLSFIKKLFGAKPVEVQPVVESAPYKVPEPAATTPIPLAAETTPAMEVSDVPAEVVSAKAPAAKAKAKKTGATKPAAAKKPRTPKAK